MKEHNDIIEQFLNGELSPEALNEFKQLMREDPGLQREVRAEQAIRGTLTHDADAIPYIATEPSGAILARLGATSVGGGAVVSSGVLQAIFGTRAGLSILSMVAASGLVLGIFLFGPMLREQESQPVQERNGPVPVESPLRMDQTGLNVIDSNEGTPNSITDQSEPSGFATSAAQGVESRRLVTDAELLSGDNQSNNAAEESSTTASSAELDQGDTLLDYLREKEKQDQKLHKIIKPDSLRLEIEVKE